MLILPLIALLLTPVIYLSLGRPRYLTSKKSLPSRISIIIPARDEEKNIATLLTTLNQQPHPPHQILVIDDQSTDNTAANAKKLGATVIAGKKLPPGWKGKTWACQQGAEQATGQWLLFLDADTTLLPHALESLAELTREKTVHSICPYHRLQKPYEQLSAYFNLITLAGVDSFALTPSQSPALFGQCLLIHRDHYQKAGGHQAVKAEILENFQLAKKLHSQNIPLQHYLGRHIIEMRMFPGGLRQLINSWKKGFVTGAAQAPKRALIITSLWLTAGMLTLGSLAFIPILSSHLYTSLTLISYAFFAFHSHLLLRLAGNFSPLTALLYPIPLLFYQLIFFKSLIDQKLGKTILWKGRIVGK